MKQMTKTATVLSLLVLVAGIVVADDHEGEHSSPDAGSWPQWRGPLGTGVAPDGDPPTTWSESENLCWKIAVPGRGHSSPIVWQDTVYLLTAIEEPSDTAGESADDDGRRGIEAAAEVRFVVLALDRATGETRWERTARSAIPHEGTHRTATWASASAVTDGELLIASFGSAGIFAYDLEGELKWERDLGDMRTRNAFGEGASPAIHGDKVVLTWDHEGSSFIVALDRETGEERWRVARDEPTSWSTPVVVEADGRAQVVVSATNRVRSYDLESGKVAWEAGGMTVNTIPTPTYADGLLYVMSGFRGSALLAIRPAGAMGDLDGGPAIVWSYDRDTSYVPSALLYDDTLYFVKSNDAILSNLNAKTGEVLFERQRLAGLEGIYASPVGAGGRVYITSQNGATVVLERGPELEVLATNKLDDGFDASAAIAGKQLFLRGRQSLYCVEESAGSS